MNISPSGFMSLRYINYVDAQTVAKNTTDFVPEIEVATSDIVDIDERMNQYLDDQSSISGFSREAHDPSTNEDREVFSLRGFYPGANGSQRSRSASISNSRGRVDCGSLGAYGTEGFPIRFKIDLKPEDPLVFVGKVLKTLKCG